MKRYVISLLVFSIIMGLAYVIHPFASCGVAGVGFGWAYWCGGEK